jgi:GT2 family glycosyltransferase
MLISKAFLKRIGLMCEDYFLFFEEIDWALRSKSQFNLVYAEDSVIYHKEGSSISSSCPKKKSYKADYYSVHNRLVFTRKHYKYRQPIVYLSLFGVMLNRVKRKQWSRVRLVLRELAQYAT